MSGQNSRSMRDSPGRTGAAIRSYLKPRTGTMLVLGAACGLPLLTISNVLGLWLTDNGVSMTDIGLFAYTLLPYSFKFVWAPILDQVRLPVLHRLLGKRRAWMLIAPGEPERRGDNRCRNKENGPRGLRSRAQPELLVLCRSLARGRADFSHSPARS